MNISDQVKRALANYEENKADFVALPEGILTEALLAEVGTGAQVTFDFTNATAGTNIAKTAKNMGKKIGFVVPTVTCGKATSQARISFAQAQSIISSGVPTWECTVTSQPSDDGKITFHNLVPNSAVGVVAPPVTKQPPVTQP